MRPPKGKNYYLSMRSKDLKWLQYKMAEMPSYFHDTTVHTYSRTHRCNSCCCEALTEIKNQLYEKNHRKITMPILDSLHDTGLAIWFLDGGSKTGRNKKNAYLNTTKFGEAGTKTIQRYFDEVGMACSVNRDGNRFKILFTVPGTVQLFKTIAHRFPSFMYGRLITTI